MENTLLQVTEIIGGSSNIALGDRGDTLPCVNTKCSNTFPSQIIGLIHGALFIVVVVSGDDCNTLRSLHGYRDNGPYNIYLRSPFPGSVVDMYCDMQTDDTGWIVSTFGSLNTVKSIMT